jgi:hypothetical protein
MPADHDLRAAVADRARDDRVAVAAFLAAEQPRELVELGVEDRAAVA